MSLLVIGVLSKSNYHPAESLKELSVGQDMGYSIFSVGENVRIVGGSFAGMVGIVAPPMSAYQANGTVVLSAPSDKQPVTVAAVIDGHSSALRVPPAFLERIPDPGREAGG